MISDHRVLRPWALALMLALLVTALVALRPVGTTMASWSDEVTVEIPAMATGGIGLDVTPGSAAGARVAVSGDVAGSWRPAAVRVSLDGQALTGAQLAGSRVEYRLAGESGQCSTTGEAPYSAQLSGDASAFPVTGGERVSGPQTLCLTFVPSDRVRVDHGGRSLNFTTELDGVAPAATWTAAGSWSASHQMPAGPRVADPTCSPGWPTVTLRWGWDHAGLAQGVNHWSVQILNRGEWQQLTTVNGADARSVVLHAWHFDRIVTFNNYQVRLAAVLPDGTQIAGKPTTVRLERLFLTGAVYCQ